MNPYCQQLTIQWEDRFNALGVPPATLHKALNYFPDDEQIDLNILFENYKLLRKLINIPDATPEMLIMLSSHFGWVDNYLDVNDGVNKINGNSISCAHLVAISGDAEIMHALLNLFPELLTITHNNNTIAHFAAQFGRLACLKKILENDSQNFCLNTRSNSGFNLADTASYFAQRECLDFLKSINVNKRKNSDDDDEVSILPAQKRTLNRLEVTSQVAKNMRIDSKYLGFDAIPKSKIEKVIGPSAENQTWSTYTVPPLAENNGTLYLTRIREENWLYASHYSYSTKPINPNDRVTFVFAGRMLAGKYPDESGTGRVILLVTKRELSENPSVRMKTLRELLTPNRDVCVIESIAMLGVENQKTVKQWVPRDEIGLIMTRRLAGFYLARYFELTHAIFSDDNICRHSVRTPEGARALQWLDIFNNLSSHTRMQNACVGSVQSWRPTLENDTDSESDPNLSEVELQEDRLGSKLFFIHFALLREKFPNYADLSLLLTHHRRLWGSDVFFQLMLMMHFNMRVLGHNELFLERAPDDKHIALKTIKPAPEWLKMKSSDFIEGSQQQVCEFIQQGVRNNIARYEKTMESLTRLNLKAKEEGVVDIPITSEQTVVSSSSSITQRGQKKLSEQDEFADIPTIALNKNALGWVAKQSAPSSNVRPFFNRPSPANSNNNTSTAEYKP